jgi:outer membrane murein-binding lipoprotein Lpp
LFLNVKETEMTMLFDSETTNIDNNLFQPGGQPRTKQMDEETGLGGGAVKGDEAIGTTTSTSLPNISNKKEERRKRVDSNAEAHTSSFMGLGGAHRRTISKLDLLGMGGTSVSGNTLSHSHVGETQLSTLVKELKAERDALRQEREALRLERESLRLERNELAKERDKLRNGL